MSRSRIVAVTPMNEAAKLASIVSPFMLLRMNDGYENGTATMTLADANPNTLLATNVTIVGAGADKWTDPVTAANDGFIYPDGKTGDGGALQYARIQDAHPNHDALVAALNPYTLKAAMSGLFIVRGLFKIKDTATATTSAVFDFFGDTFGSVRCALNSSMLPTIGMRTADSSALLGGAPTGPMTAGTHSIMWVWNFATSTMSVYLDSTAPSTLAFPNASQMVTTAALLAGTNLGINLFCRGTGAGAQSEYMNAGPLDAERTGVAELFVCRCATDLSADLSTIASKWVKNPRQIPSEFVGA